MAKRLDPKDFKFAKQTGKTLVKVPGQINGQSFMIEDLVDCNVYLFDFTGEVLIDSCKNCRIMIGPCDGSVFARDCTGCCFSVVSRQFRIRSCIDCDCYLWVPGSPVIELSHTIRIGEWNIEYEGLAGQYRSANLDPHGQNTYNDIHDFSAKDANLPKPPHWSPAVPREKQTLDFNAIFAAASSSAPANVSTISNTTLPQASTFSWASSDLTHTSQSTPFDTPFDFDNVASRSANPFSSPIKELSTPFDSPLKTDFSAGHNPFSTPLHDGGGGGDLFSSSTFASPSKPSANKQPLTSSHPEIVSPSKRVVGADSAAVLNRMAALIGTIQENTGKIRSALSRLKEAFPAPAPST